MTIRQFINAEIEKLREKTKETTAALAILDNPNSSVAEKTRGMRFLFVANQALWAELFELTKPTNRKKVSVASSVVPKLGPTKPVVTTAPARTLGVPVPKLALVGTSDFAQKLNGALTAGGMENHSLIGQFRSIMGEESFGLEYWDRCRKITAAVLSGELIREEADWRLLAEKMKKNLFFSGRNAQPFLKQCPGEIIKDLLLAKELWSQVEKIYREEENNRASPYRIGFIIDMCLVVGQEARNILINCKHAVNRMKQKGFIQDNHWLAKKVATMKVSSQPLTTMMTPENTLAPMEEAAPVTA